MSKGHGPFTRTYQRNGVGFASDIPGLGGSIETTWYTQPKPFKAPLRFVYRKALVVAFTGPGTPWSYVTPGNDDLGWLAPDSSTVGPNVYNKAYDRFKDKVYADSAGMAVNMAQRQQAADMIASNCTTLYNAARQTRSGNFSAAARSLGLTDAPGGMRNRGLAKNFGRNWLMLHFGWEPIIKDLYASAAILQDGIPPSWVKTSAMGKEEARYTRYNGGTEDRFKRSTTIRWTIGAEVSVENPNLHLANELGLLNPALVAWDVIPWSFVVGWFVNFDSFLGQLTDFAGLSLSKSYVTCGVESKTERTQVHYNWPYNQSNTVFWVAQFERCQIDRIPGSIPGPALKVKPFKALSLSRGLTASALLVQFLR